MIIRKCLLSLVCFYGLQPAFSQDSLSYPDLLKRMYDMKQLATPPSVHEKAGNFSSYDRRSVYDSVTNSYIAWAANGDGSGYIRKEGNDVVVFEKDGPGVIWRFWSALAKDGHIRIFIDDESVPVVDKPFRDFFETTGNEVPPLNYPNMVMTLSRGRNHFLPIPYKKYCRIVLSPEWGAYYHITYTSFPPNTRVPSYSGSFGREEGFALAETDRILSDRGYKQFSKGEDVAIATVRLETMAEITAITLTGNRAVTRFEIEVDPTLPEDKQHSLISDVWLDIKWDGEANPSVLAPIGMFFGTYPKIYPYRTVPVGFNGHSFYSNWWMPFSGKAQFSLINKGTDQHDIKLRVISLPLTENPDNMMRFNANWHKGLELSPSITLSKNPDRVVADFENGSYSDWKLTGDAFGTQPAQGARSPQSEVSGYRGRYLVNSFMGTDSTVGSLTSTPFLINRKYLNFLIGGGGNAGKTGIELIVEGKVVRTASGMETEQLMPMSWDVSVYSGKKGVVRIIDFETGGWGHILVDHITLSDQNTAPTDGRAIDWPFLKVTGRGRFCGLTLHVQNEWERPQKEAETWWYGKWDKKSIDWWWGEGDEKFFVDGEKFPSTFGTGSEDYIGYAWSAEPPFPVFDSPFASQPFTAIDGNGHTLVNRFHIADNVPFQTSFEGYLEKYKADIWGKKNICLFDVVVYWYQMKK